MKIAKCALHPLVVLVAFRVRQVMEIFLAIRKERKKERVLIY